MSPLYEELGRCKFVLVVDAKRQTFRVVILLF